MGQETAHIDRVIQLADRLRLHWDRGEVSIVMALVAKESRGTLEQVIYTLLNDLEAATGQ